MFFVKARIKKTLEANDLIHDAIVMGVADKYILEENLGKEDFGLQLLGRDVRSRWGHLLCHPRHERPAAPGPRRHAFAAGRGASQRCGMSLVVTR